MPSRYRATARFVHVPAPGSVVVCMSCASVAARKLVVGHVPDSNGGALVLTVQALAPPVGSAELKTVPAALSVMKHSGCFEQKIAVKKRLLSISLIDQALVPPVGSVDVATLPSMRTATQRCVDGQLTSLMGAGVPASAVDQAGAPPVGSVVV